MTSDTLTLTFGNRGAVDVTLPAELHEVATSCAEQLAQTIQSIPADLVLCLILFIANSPEHKLHKLPQTVRLVCCLLQYYDEAVIRGRDIHAYAQNVEGVTPDDRLWLVNTYYSARKLVFGECSLDSASTIFKRRPPQCFLYAAFGGQGNTTHYIEEVRRIRSLYKAFIEDLLVAASQHLQGLARQAAATQQLMHGMDLIQWLQPEKKAPTTDYIISAPISMPLVGLTQLLSFKGTLRAAGLSPRDFPSVFNGFNGHSQGIVTAAAAATATCWTTFDAAALDAITLLFWIGVRTQEQYPHDLNPIPRRREELIQKGIRTPSPMLSVQNMKIDHVYTRVASLNAMLPRNAQICVSLINGVESTVLSGLPSSLVAFVDELYEHDQACLSSQSKRIRASCAFLPVAAPFHSEHLRHVTNQVQNDVQDISIRPSSLRVPVNGSITGSSEICTSLNDLDTDNLIPALLQLVTTEPVRWVDTSFPNATHIVDFGPGMASGVGALLSRNLVGTGTCIIAAGAFNEDLASSDIKSCAHLFVEDEGENCNDNWQKHFSPSVVQTSSGPIIGTKLSRLLGLPPFIIAGMTPTTTHPEFVSAAMHAGYHAELAAGAFHDAADMMRALEALRAMMPHGRRITINIIYLAPRALSWQIPLIRRLCSEGFPIDSITVGGGVPSQSVASEYITTLGLRYISFKPSSADAIRSVLEIARSHPLFPIVLQWTGGRGGGHHSDQDFHQPVVETYGEIRRCPNVILVAGSGFGSADDAIPYITGTWSMDTRSMHGKAPIMPFDGILLGSRVMTCKEAITSFGAKRCITQATGVSDAEWEKTMSGGAGGIISVRSEMGEPIHVVATRGAMLWRRLDDLIFRLPKKKQLESLKANRDLVINGLNRDFQRVWFGRNEQTGLACDLDDMTYAEVLRRMSELMYVPDEWIHESYKSIFYDFMKRCEERFAQFVFHVAPDNQQPPLQIIARFVDAHPAATETLLIREDVDHFLALCRRPKQKPVPFIPTLDDEFETWFKKDSLWQSERVETLVDGDPERTFILHGPVAARASVKVDELVEQVMHSINSGVLSRLVCSDKYEEFLSCESNAKSQIEEYSKPGPGTYRYVDVSSFPRDRLASLLGGTKPSWRYALFRHQYPKTPAAKIVDSLEADTVQFVLDEAQSEVFRITVMQKQEDGSQKALLTVGEKAGSILLRLFPHPLTSTPLSLRYEYHPKRSFAPIEADLSADHLDRVYNFYSQLWLRTDDKIDSYSASPVVTHDTIEEASVQRYIRATGNLYALRGPIPLDYSTVLGWKAIAKALLSRPIKGNLLQLVHLDHQYCVVNKQLLPLAVGQKVTTEARVDSITVGEKGKTIKIVAAIRRHDETVLRLTNRFLIRGSLDGITFATEDEEAYILPFATSSALNAVKAKTWFFPSPDSEVDSLVGNNLVFKLQTRRKGDELDTDGNVFLGSKQVASIHLSCVPMKGQESNPVMDFLKEWGKPQRSVCPLHSPVAIPCTDVFEAPSRALSEEYSKASGDFNPIHTSPLFAAYAGLPDIIAHGMFCSAKARHAIVRHAADGHEDRVTKFAVKFVGMVTYGNLIAFSMEHVAMCHGLKVIKLKAYEQTIHRVVLEAEAHVQQPPTVIVFAGQGSQTKGMGMSLRESSEFAREIWDQSDDYYEQTFGFRLSDVVSENPTKLTVHFRGMRGRQLKANYLKMGHLFPSLDQHTKSYTYSYPEGLLFTTAFAQPALVVMELAAFRDAQQHGLVPDDVKFAGHSLGEYAALAANTGFMQLPQLLYAVFCRGLTMHASVKRDSHGRSDFGMIAANPRRVAADFSDSRLCQIVEAVNSQPGCFVEIVNYNVLGSQYVCAGNLSGLDCVQKALDAIAGGSCGDERLIQSIIDAQSTDVTLHRGVATIPLSGIDVPFHSSKLQPMMQHFKKLLLENMDPVQITSDGIIGKYIPNVIGKPFRVDREYIQVAQNKTGSQVLQSVLDKWEDYWEPRIKQELRDLELAQQEGL